MSILKNTLDHENDKNFKNNLNTIEKKVNQNELTILCILNQLQPNILPKIISINYLSKIVTFAKYRFTLSDFIYQINKINKNNKTIEYMIEQTKLKQNIKNKILNLINCLHKNKIIHGDLHIANIIVDCQESDIISADNKIEIIDIKLIDFGISSLFDEIDEKKIKLYNSLYSIYPPAKNINDLMKWEIKCVSMIIEEFDFV